MWQAPYPLCHQASWWLLLWLAARCQCGLVITEREFQGLLLYAVSHRGQNSLSSIPAFPGTRIRTHTLASTHAHRMAYFQSGFYWDGQ